MAKSNKPSFRQLMPQIDIALAQIGAEAKGIAHKIDNPNRQEPIVYRAAHISSRIDVVEKQQQELLKLLQHLCKALHKTTDVLDKLNQGSGLEKPP